MKGVFETGRLWITYPSSQEGLWPPTSAEMATQKVASNQEDFWHVSGSWYNYHGDAQWDLLVTEKEELDRDEKNSAALHSQ